MSELRLSTTEWLLVMYRADTSRLRRRLAEMRMLGGPAWSVTELANSVASDAAIAWAELHRPEGVP
jgi:hypothetical protein